MHSYFSGGFNENFIMNEIRKSFLNNNMPFNAYYYRDSNQNEIDLVLLYDGKLYLIEIKQGMSYNESHIKNFNQLQSKIYSVDNKLIVCSTLENYPINREVMVVSVKCI